MRRLFGSMMAFAVLAALGMGCGSTGDPTTGTDAQVFSFVRFDNTGIMQADAVGANTAIVDVVQGCCLMGGGIGTSVMVTVEPFTPTLINAVFRNREINDIQIDHYELQVVDPQSGLGDSLTYPIGATVIGGRCSNVPDRSCATDTNCSVAGVLGTCTFVETLINDILLFDFDSKSRVEGQLNAVNGVALPVTLTFFGSDVSGNSFRAVARYTAEFTNLCNCGSGETCISLNQDGTCAL